MGVWRRIDEVKPIRIEDQDEVNYGDYDFSESDNEANDADKTATAVPVSRTRRRKEERSERKLRKFFLSLDDGGVQVKKNMGARKQRRVENARLLLSFVDKEDICTDFSDIVPKSVSSFAQLFHERENMKIWNEFILLDEEDQRRILDNADRRKKHDGDMNLKGDGWCVVGGRSAESTPRRNDKKSTSLPEESDEDHRKHHPAYSAKACFERMEPKFKQFFQHRELPWALVDKTERQLRDAFGLDSSAIWIANYESGFDRMIVHGVAQFLMLTSKSSTDTASHQRITEVKNSRSFFVPPRKYLIVYLEKLRKHKIVFDPEEDEPLDSNSDHLGHPGDSPVEETSLKADQASTPGLYQIPLILTRALPV
ncbi:unnamed protein product, partial [Mesorhabditis spiculigera]